jgi:hypothetical protein
MQQLQVEQLTLMTSAGLGALMRMMSPTHPDIPSICLQHIAAADTKDWPA